MAGFLGRLRARPQLVGAVVVMLVGGLLALVVATSGGGSSGRPLKQSAGTTTTAPFGADESSTTTADAPVVTTQTSTTVHTAATTAAHTTKTTTRRTGASPATPPGAGPADNASTQPPPGQPPAPPFANICPSSPVDVPTSPGMYVVGLDGSEHHFLPQNHLVGQASVAPDGSVAVVADQNGSTMLVDLANGNVLNTTVLDGIWSHDSRRLVATKWSADHQSYSVVITDRSGTVLKDFGKIGRQAPFAFAWSPDDSVIAEMSGNFANEPAATAGIVLIDAASGAFHNLTNRYYSSITWSADGTKLLAAFGAEPPPNDTGHVDLVSTTDGSFTQVRSGASFAGFTDHNSVAVAGDKYGLYDVPLGGGSERAITNAQVVSWSNIVSPDGKYVMVRVWPDGAHPNPGLYLVDTNPGGCARLMVKTGNTSFIWGGWLPAGRGFIIYPYPS